MWRDDLHAAAVTVAAGIILIGGSAVIYTRQAAVRGREVLLHFAAERLRRAMLGRE